MFDSLKARLIIIGALIVLSVWALWPRTVVVTRAMPDGSTRADTAREINLKRGLDLRGGIHLALELDESGGAVPNKADAIDRALKVIRTRVDEFGVAEPLVQKEGSSRIVVELAGIDDPSRAIDIVKRSAFLEFQMTDKDQQFRRVLPAMDRALTAAGVTEASLGRQLADSTGRTHTNGPPAPTSAVEDILAASRNTDTSKAQTTAANTRRGARDSSAQRHDTAADTSSDLLGGVLSALLFQGGMPGEYLVASEKYEVVNAMLMHPAAQRLLPRGITWRWGAQEMSRGARSFRPLYALQERPIMTGEYLVDAQARIDPLYNQSVVDFQLSRRGGRTFERETGRHVGDYMAIVLDHKVQSQPPVIRSQIGARGQIELGSASLQDAQDLALVLKAGSLPAPLQIMEQRTVGPSLGADSIHKSLIAGLVGIGLVVLIMIGYYHFAGVLSVAALGLYVLFTLGGLAAFGATLTLPGMAGFVLSIGIAVDANVLIFERIREELLHGKSVRLAIDAGFKMAMNAIVDSNVSTILTAAFLFQFGTGPVKGFAITLILGILASMVTAIFVTRTFFMLYLARSRDQLQTLSI
jgi:preprotein translocase subunit SecD